MHRIADHAKHYETIETSAGPYVKIYNVGERLVVNNIRGYLQSRIVFFLMNVHHKKRTIWFARVSCRCLARPCCILEEQADLRTPSQSGHSQVDHSYKADSDLSPQGIEYAEKLRDFIVNKRAELLKERVQNGEAVAERRLTVRRRLKSHLCPIS